MDHTLANVKVVLAHGQLTQAVLTLMSVQLKRITPHTIVVTRHLALTVLEAGIVSVTQVRLSKGCTKKVPICSEILNQ